MMKIVIDIDEEIYNHMKERFMYAYTNTELDKVGLAVRNGIPLPNGHGRLIDKDHIIARLEAASKFYGGENADAFDERFSHGLKEAAIKVAEESTIIEADKERKK